MRSFKCVIAGSALIMHNGRLANPRDPYAKAIKALTGSKKKSDDDHEAISKAEFLGSLYHDDKLGPYLPGVVIESMIVQGSRRAKQGKEFVTVGVEEECIALEYDGPRDYEGLWGDERFPFVRGVVIAGKRVQRTRALFSDWRLSFQINLEDGASVNSEDIERALRVAGRMIGLGDWRPGSPHGGRYGRFSVEHFEEISQAKAA